MKRAFPESILITFLERKVYFKSPRYVTLERYCRVANFLRYGKRRKIAEIEYKTENTENNRKPHFDVSKSKKKRKENKTIIVLG